MEFTRLVEGVHAGGGIEHQQHFLGSAGRLAPHHTMKFLQLLHEIVFGVQPACGIHE